jgi:hypothetical protein
MRWEQTNFLIFQILNLPLNTLAKISLIESWQLLFAQVLNHKFRQNLKMLGIGLQKVCILLFEGAVTSVRDQGSTCKGGYAIATV